MRRASSDNKIAIIGLGNTLRSDDGIGIHVLDILQRKYKGREVFFKNFGIASFDLIFQLSDYKKVLLIDAIDAGLEPATLKIFKLNEASYPIRQKKVSSHELTLGDLIELCQKFGVSSEIQVAGIQVKDVSCGLEITPELKKARTHIVDALEHFISSWLESSSR
jgi:hydrogenase maturation protease